VLVGLLRLPPEEMHRAGRADSVAEGERHVRDFRAMWEQYDWTKQLHN
jgi:hypothetical protein